MTFLVLFREFLNLAKNIFSNQMKLIGINIFSEERHCLVFHNEVPHLEVPGCHQPPALVLHLLDDQGDTEPPVPGPVRHLALLAAVGHRVALGALLGPGLAAFHALGQVTETFRHFE